jgi:hypothetical protein
MNILLSDEKIAEAWESAEAKLGFPNAKWKYNDTQDIDLVHNQEVSQAQLIEAIKWGEEACTEHPMSDFYAADTITLDDGITWYYAHRFNCPECRKELNKLVKEI